MTIIAFISTALLTFIVGYILGAWCERQITLDEMKNGEK